MACPSYRSYYSSPPLSYPPHACLLLLPLPSCHMHPTPSFSMLSFLCSCSAHVGMCARARTHSLCTDRHKFKSRFLVLKLSPGGPREGCGKTPAALVTWATWFFSVAAFPMFLICFPVCSAGEGTPQSCACSFKHSADWARPEAPIPWGYCRFLLIFLAYPDSTNLNICVLHWFSKQILPLQARPSLISCPLLALWRLHIFRHNIPILNM